MLEMTSKLTEMRNHVKTRTVMSLSRAAKTILKKINYNVFICAIGSDFKILDNRQ